MYKNLSILLVSSLLICSGAFAAEPLFMVNEPEDMGFADMNQIGAYIDSYNKDIGLTTNKHTNRFFEVLEKYGAPEAGSSDLKVGLVIQDAFYETNQTGEPRGVLVVAGRFDKQKILDELRKNYKEVAEKASNTPTTYDGYNEALDMETHHFLLPPSNRRELCIANIGNRFFFSSAAQGDYELLKHTIDVVKNNKFQPKASLTSSVHYRLDLNDQDRRRLVHVIDAGYEQYKERKAVKGGHKIKKFFVNRVSDHKLKLLEKSLGELHNFDLQVNRVKGDGTSSKTVHASMTFADESRARKVKRKLLRDFTKAIKNSKNVKEKFSMSNNVKIRCKGNECTLACNLNSDEEMMKTMGIISSYVIKSLIPGN